RKVPHPCSHFPQDGRSSFSQTSCFRVAQSLHLYVSFYSHRATTKARKYKFLNPGGTMGEHNVSTERDSRQAQAFMKSLLADVYALERMIESGRIESGVRRIGAEQEMFLIDRAMRPAPVASEILENANDRRLTTELGKFNLEANLSPRPLADRSLREMEEELSELMTIARRAARSCNADVLLTGILPTIRQSDLTLDNLTPIPRYHALIRAMNQLRGSAFNIHIKGLDELHATHDNLMFEACCCSFQV